MNDMTPDVATTIEELDVAIVGAGFSGLYQLHKLRQLGYKVKVIDAGADIGGTWYFNCYPGARVDTTGALYQYSDPDLWKEWDFSELYPDWKELRRYFSYVDSKWKLRKDVRLNTRVIAAKFDESARKWVIETSDGRITHATFFVPCTGFASKPFIPAFPGIGDFKGEMHHTGLWPQTGVDFDGKRVAVIGTGASAVQVIQEVGKTAAHLTVFQRTPNLTLPMRQVKISKAESAERKKTYADDFARRAKGFGGFEYDFIPKSALEVSAEERHATYASIWKTGGFQWWLGTFNDVLLNQEANDTAYEFWRTETRKRIWKPELVELLAPTVQPHPFGTKRPCLEQDFYEVLQQDNVTVVDLKATPITKFTENGINTSDAEHEFDLIILSTGFDAVSGGLTQMNIQGTSGQTLNEKWKNGIRAHLGMACADFPNMLFLYGPQSPSGFCNGPTCAELQGDVLIKMLETMRAKGITRIEATHDAEDAWRKQALEIADMTLFPKTNSWYMGANIPGKARELLAFPGGLPYYLTLTEKCIDEEFSGFDVR